jgi:hypothetical protein
VDSIACIFRRFSSMGREKVENLVQEDCIFVFWRLCSKLCCVHD